MGTNCCVETDIILSSKKFFAPNDPIYLMPAPKHEWIPLPNVDNLPDQVHNRKLPAKCQHCNKYTGMFVPNVGQGGGGCSSCSMH